MVDYDDHLPTQAALLAILLFEALVSLIEYPKPRPVRGFSLVSVEVHPLFAHARARVNSRHAPNQLNRHSLLGIAEHRQPFPGAIRQGEFS
ncbi:MAG: hypothetical protein ABTQ26_08865 [Azonexus sp.]